MIQADYDVYLAKVFTQRLATEPAQGLAHGNCLEKTSRKNVNSLSIGVQSISPNTTQRPPDWPKRRQSCQRTSPPRQLGHSPGETPSTAIINPAGVDTAERHASTSRSQQWISSPRTRFAVLAEVSNPRLASRICATRMDELTQLSCRSCADQRHTACRSSLPPLHIWESSGAWIMTFAQLAAPGCSEAIGQSERIAVMMDATHGASSQQYCTGSGLVYIVRWRSFSIGGPETILDWDISGTIIRIITRKESFYVIDEHSTIRGRHSREIKIESIDNRVRTECQASRIQTRNA